MKLLVKIGGTLVDDPARRLNVVSGISALHAEGHQIAVVHGGGKQITRFLDERGIVSRFVNGLRVTTAEVMDAVVKVVAGAINKDLVCAFRKAGVSAVGFSGIDGGLVTATELSPDLGCVGHVEAADAKLLDLLNAAGYVPVVACIGANAHGVAFNINADSMAAACAIAYRAEYLIFLTDVPGVLDQSGGVIPALNTDDIGVLISSGVAHGGMQAKLEAARSAVGAGVANVIVAGCGSASLVELLHSAAASTLHTRIAA